jgi:hypothetical protein
LGEARFVVVDERDLGIVHFLYQPKHPDRIIVLDGNGARLHDEKALGKPRIDNSTRVAEYLALFCAHHWGPNGAYEILDAVHSAEPIAQPVASGAEVASGDASIPPISAPTLIDDVWTVTSDVRYGTAIGRFSFEVGRDGSVSIPRRHALKPETDPANLWGRAVPPMRWVALPEAGERITSAPPPLGPGSRWNAVNEKLEKRLWSAVYKRLQPQVQLYGAQAGALDDEDGQRWGEDLRLELDGFNYARIQAEHRNPYEQGERRGGGLLTSGSRHEDRTTLRQRWLQSGPGFRPQPYEHLAKLWRSEGSYTDADDMTFTRLTRERLSMDGPVVEGRRRLLVWAAFLLSMVGIGLIAAGLLATVGDVVGSIAITVFGLSGLLLLSSSTLKQIFLEKTFGYGLKVSYAARFVLALWLLGGVLAFLGTDGISGHALKIDTSSIGTVAGQSANYPNLVLPVVAVTGTTGADEIACVGQIDPMLYALDVLVPLLDLRQEQRCRPSSEPGAWFLRYLKVLYAIVGWVAISGLVLTASGVARRQVEG